MSDVRIVIVASTLHQYERARELLRLPRSRASFAVSARYVTDVPLEHVVVATPCRSRSRQGAIRYEDAVREVHRMEARTGGLARRIDA